MAGGGARGPREDCRGIVRRATAVTLSASHRGALGGMTQPTAQLVKHKKGPFSWWPVGREELALKEVFLPVAFASGSGETAVGRAWEVGCPGLPSRLLWQ